MTPDEFLNELLNRLQAIEGEKTPETKAYILILQTAVASEDESIKAKTMQTFLELGKKLIPTEQQAEPEQKPVLPLAPDPNYPTERRGNPRWAELKQNYAVFGDEYRKYKEQANKGVKAGLVILLVLWVLALFPSWWTATEIVNGFESSIFHGLFKLVHVDYLFLCLLYYKWYVLIPMAIVVFLLVVISEGIHEPDLIKRAYRKFGLEVILFFWAVYLSLANGIPDIRIYVGPLNLLLSALSFLGWCAIWGLVVYVLFQRANVGSEGKLYFITFGIELIINTIRLYIVFVILFVPVFIGVMFYGAYQGQQSSTLADYAFQKTSFWGWWIPAIFGSINLAMSLGIFFGWNAPVSGIKLSFDSRDMTSEEKDYMIRFYRRLVESGRGNEQVFKSWNIIESSGVFAFTYGANIFISRGSFTERYFNALVAHEIGHLHNRDGLVLQALHSFTYPLFNHLLFNPTTIQKGVIEQDKDFSKPNSLLSGIISSMTITFFTLIFGGWSVQALARFWSKFYIERDYLADDYAIELGFAGELLNYLDSYKDFDTALPLFNRWRGYTRVRIERIRTKIEMSV